MAETTKIKVKTENEQLLYKYYSAERADNEQLRNVISDMEKQIESLQQQVRYLQHKAQQSTAATSEPAEPIKSPTQCPEYCTDEEELARETQWIRQKSRKKRKLNTSPTHTANIEHLETVQTEKAKIKKIPPPPPVVVDGVENYQALFDLLSKSESGDKFTTKMLNGKCVKINAVNEDTYRSITKLLTENNFLWHSYENKQERPIRVMVKNLHFTCEPARIIEDLKSKGFQIEDAANKLRWKNKEPLNMFMMTFRNEEDINKIYSIKSILGCKVEVHPLHTSRLVPQCKKCQAYGHTHKYCSKEPRCVKCTGKHLTADCKKPADEKPKCIHCGEPHPANYRGCIVAREMQGIKNKIMKKPAIKGQRKINEIVQTRSQTQSHYVTQNPHKKTYAHIAAKTVNLANIRENVNADKGMEGKLDEIIKLMSSFNARLDRLENSATNAISRPKK